MKEAGYSSCSSIHYLHPIHWHCTGAVDIILNTTDPFPIPLSLKKKVRGTSVQSNKTAGISLNFQTEIISYSLYWSIFSFKNARNALLNFLSLPISLWKNIYLYEFPNETDCLIII